jgi:regulator of sigma E protease
MQILSSAFFFVLAIGVLVTVHEFGHFWVARRLGVKVLRFSVGFGKPLLSWRRKNDPTEYVIAAIPLGGYVQMLDEREGPVDVSERDQAFNRKPILSRCAVVVAGPVFNFLFAILAYWLVFMLGVNGLKPIVGSVTPGSMAAQAGFQSLDVIKRVDNTETPTWNSVFLQLLAGSLDQQQVKILVDDDLGAERVRLLDFQSLPMTIDSENLADMIGFRPYRVTLPAVIGQIELGGAADQAGFEVGDKVIAWNGQAVSSWEAWVQVIREHPEQNLSVTIERDNQEMALTLLPARSSTAKGDIGRIGAGVNVPPGFGEDMVATIRYPVFRAFVLGTEKTFDMSMLTLRMLGHMLRGSVSASNISGPISIAQYAGYSAGIGLVAFLGYLALISISLGVLNLLPIPILDGGHLLYYMIEFVKGSPVSEQTMMFGQRIGIALLVCVMVLAFYNDLVRLLG